MQKPFLILLDEEERVLQHRDHPGARALKDSSQSSKKDMSKTTRRADGRIDIIRVQIRIQDIGGLT